MAKELLPPARTVAQLWDLLYQRQNPEHPCFSVRGHGPAHTLTYRELHARIQCLTAYLFARGLRIGDRVLLLADNDPSYPAFEWATLRAGGVVVTLSRQFASHQVRQILEETTPRIVFLESYAVYRQRSAYLDNLPDTELICHTDRLDELRETDRVITLDSAIEQGKQHWRLLGTELGERLDAIGPTDTATIFYDRKAPQVRGVVHTHQTLLAQLAELVGALPALPAGSRLLSALSPAYPYQRIAGLYLPLILDLHPVHLQEVRVLAEAIPLERPRYLLATPLLLESLLRTWRQTLGVSLKTYRTHLAAALRYHQLRQTGGRPGLLLRLRYARALRNFFRPLANRFLPGVEHIFCYGAQLEPRLELIFRSVGVPLVPGFGLTETAGPIALNDLHAPKVGSVGIPFSGITFNSLNNGGLLEIDGPCLAAGYWPNRPLSRPFATNLRAKTHNGLLYLE